MNPTIISAVLTHSFIDVTFSEGCYTNNNATGALTTADFALTYTDNADGGSSNATISSVCKVIGNGAVVAGDSTIRINITTTGIPLGLATIEIKAATNAIYNAAGEVMANTQTTGVKVLNPFLHIYVDRINGSDAYSGFTPVLPKATITGAQAITTAGENKFILAKAYYAESPTIATSTYIVTISADDGTVFGNNRTQDIDWYSSTAFGKFNNVAYGTTLNNTKSHKNNFITTPDGTHYIITSSGSYGYRLYKSIDLISWITMPLPQIYYLTSNITVLSPSTSCTLYPDSNNDLHIVLSGRTNSQINVVQIIYCKYTSSTNTFSQLITISNYAYAQYNQSVCVDSNDIIHMVWQGGTPTYSSSDQIFYSRSTDGGGTFSSPVIINDSPSNTYYQGSPVITVDSSNNLYVVWAGRDIVTGTTNAQIKLTKSTNAGVSWSVGTYIHAAIATSQANPDIIIDSSNNINVVWNGPDPAFSSTQQTKFSRSIDGGSSWTAWINIQGSISNKIIPTITIDTTTTNIYVASAISSTLVQSVSVNSGVTWSTWVSLSNGTEGNNNNYNKNIRTFTNPILLCNMAGTIVIRGRKSLSINSVAWNKLSTDLASLRQIDNINIILNSGELGSNLTYRIPNTTLTINGGIWQGHYHTLGNVYSSIGVNNAVVNIFINFNNTIFSGCGNTNDSLFIPRSVVFPLYITYTSCSFYIGNFNLMHDSSESYNFITTKFISCILNFNTNNGLFSIGSTNTHLLNLIFENCTLSLYGTLRLVYSVGPFGVYNAIYRPKFLNCTLKRNGSNFTQFDIDDSTSLSQGYKSVSANAYDSIVTQCTKISTIQRLFSYQEDSRTFYDNINNDNIQHYYTVYNIHYIQPGTSQNSRIVEKYFSDIITQLTGRTRFIELNVNNGTAYTLTFDINQHISSSASDNIIVSVYRGQDPYATPFATATYAFNTHSQDTWYEKTLTFTPNSDEPYFFAITVPKGASASLNYVQITKPTIA